jgi:RNA polymerase sigma-70 factor, ECF subfamily
MPGCTPTKEADHDYSVFAATRRRPANYRVNCLTPYLYGQNTGVTSMHASMRAPDAELDIGLIREVDRNEALAGEHEIRAGIGAHISRLRRYGVSLSHRLDDADDLVQATFVRALERAAQFRAGTRLDLWLFSILRSIWLNEVRARKVRAGQGLVDADSVSLFDGVREAEVGVLANQVLRLADALPEAQRTAVHLAYVEGLSYREIAEAMHVPVGTVMSRIATARAKLIESATPGSADMSQRGRSVAL